MENLGNITSGLSCCGQTGCNSWTPNPPSSTPSPTDSVTTSSPAPTTTNNTAGSLHCMACTDQTCTTTALSECGSETMCITASIIATSSGTTTERIYKGCAPSHLCQVTGMQNFSANLGFSSVHASALCCNSENCNSQSLPMPQPQPSNNLQCLSCDPQTSNCSTMVTCSGEENSCLTATVQTGPTTYPVHGCVTKNTCEAAGSLHCMACTDQTCTTTALSECGSETMCITASIIATSSGTTTERIYKGCAPSHLCQVTGMQNFSANLGFSSIHASALCCNSENCNSQSLPMPQPQPSNNLQCLTCNPQTSNCSTMVTCSGEENSCLTATVKDLDLT
nr:urokinase plasminogen activator surface receptor-like [Nothobranchius furzeri]